MVRIISCKKDYLQENLKYTVAIYSKKEELELAFVDKKRKKIYLNREYKDRFKKAYNAIKKDYEDCQQVDYLSFK